MKSTFFNSDACLTVAEKIKESINTTPNILSKLTANSPRAAGDAIENLIGEKFEEVANEFCNEYSSSFARRAMADLAFTDKEGFYCIVDVKTHRQNTKFNMPALTSVKRLTRFYEDDKNIFSIMMISYKIKKNHIDVSEVVFCPIEFLDWQCLTIGALGWGQIQIMDSKNIIVNHGYSRKKWMLSLCDIMLEFYPKEILKINERNNIFKSIKSDWQKKRDVWS